MCGVFGFVSYDGKGPNLSCLEAVAVNTERRGRDSFGWAWIDGRGRLKMFKRPGRVSHHLDLLGMLADARMLVGHCRWATHGRWADNANNHPHPADGGWLVHNGVVPGHDRIQKARGFEPVTDCDSEVLCQLVEAGGGNLLARCATAARAAGGGPLVMLGLWSRPNRLVAVRSGNPLSMGQCKGGRYYLASLPDALPGAVSEVEDGTAFEFAARGMGRVARRVRTGVA